MEIMVVINGEEMAWCVSVCVCVCVCVGGFRARECTSRCVRVCVSVCVCVSGACLYAYGCEGIRLYAYMCNYMYEHVRVVFVIAPTQ